ncbi:F-box-like domain protein [Rhizoctonia solani 123E]|uniref:F-box-like domain protein n=1 Tax=Rhizoctonia solani 123E TaxID=1423351 RepID=A0A074S0J3_9AGAM|nr:F-box-like domain protein [Rhizoctonia solani 123E]
MTDELKLASDQLCVAWNNYQRVCSNLENHLSQRPFGASSFPSEVCRLLDTEVDLVSSYEPRIQEIKIAVRRARNYSSGIAPINTLPPEILTRIFQLVLAPPCNLHLLSDDDDEHYPRYPDYLTHVCSQWRRIAISSRSLWCHIDLSCHEIYSVGLAARARAHVARSGELPLELHILFRQ